MFRHPKTHYVIPFHAKYYGDDGNNHPKTMIQRQSDRSLRQTADKFGIHGSSRGKRARYSTRLGKATLMGGVNSEIMTR